MKLKFTGIKRKEIYSPNHITNDYLILMKTGEVLKSLGNEVEILEEAFIETHDIDDKIIFSMAQGQAGLMRLQEFENNGAMIINSPSSALNSYRINMINMLTEASIPFPRSIILEDFGEAKNVIGSFPNSKLWLKRGDVHAEHKEDVTLVYSQNELDTTLEEFYKRGINKTVIQEHLSGDTIKFYGVLGSGFFHWYYLNGHDYVVFDLDELKNLAFRSAEVLGLDVFGGDVIVSPQGTLSIIDINDWPSFAPIRDEAAKNIGQFIHRKALSYVEQN
jgi:glutathione synthase/RimK-type ligase-like ATP-grasp enzyme